MLTIQSRWMETSINNGGLITMTGHEYLKGLLANYNLTDADVEKVQNKRKNVEDFLRKRVGDKIDRFYYSGSYAKKTAINLDYDLDLCIYFKPDSYTSLRTMYEDTCKNLKDMGQIDPRNVSIRLPQGGGLSVDVVPGRLISTTSDDINLYSRLKDTSMKSNIPKHKDVISQSDCRPIIKLMKIWKYRRGIHYKSFALELLTIEALKNCPKDDYGNALWRVLTFAAANVETIKLIDPANGNNDVSDSITSEEKTNFKNQAASSLKQQYWKDIVW